MCDAYDANARKSVRTQMALPISRRFGLLVMFAVLGCVSAIAGQLFASRTALIQERKVFLSGQVQAAASIVRKFVSEVESGRLSETQAQEQAKAILRSIRFGKNDYIFVYSAAGVNIAHGAKPELEGKNLSDQKDTDGVLFVRDTVAAGMRNEGGYVYFRFPRAGSDVPEPKLAYALNVGPWNWIIGTGVYIDDLDNALYNSIYHASLWALALITALCAISLLIARGLVNPLQSITRIMTRLASGEVDVDIPGCGRRDEVGEIARAVAIFKTNDLARRKLEIEKDESERLAAVRRKADMSGLADQFEAAVGGVIRSVSSASNDLQTTAFALTRTADMTQKMSATVSAASSESSASVQAVAAATNQLMSSINEISRQAHGSARMTNDAVALVDRTDSRFHDLSQSAARISDVVELIKNIAEQTNLLALNATIEAARAGDAGKGFAVVAHEVKALATQTAKATCDISEQIAGMQAATEEAVLAIKDVGGTIRTIAEIVSGIAAAVEEQEAASNEISRNLQHVAGGASQVSLNIAQVSHGAKETGDASKNVVLSSKKLFDESDQLKVQVQMFLSNVRNA